MIFSVPLVVVTTGVVVEISVYNQEEFTINKKTVYSVVNVIVCTYFRKATRKVYVYIYVYIFFFSSLLNCLFFYSIEFECLKHTRKTLHLLLIFLMK